MKLLSILCPASILFCSIYGAERPDAWQTHGGDISANSIVWNHKYGQHELGHDAGDRLILAKQPEDAQLYGTACAALAPASIAILGTRFGSNDISKAPAERIAAIMSEILFTGARAYDMTEKDTRTGFAESEAIVKTIREQNQRLPIINNKELVAQYFINLDTLFGPTYVPEDPMRMLINMLHEHVQAHPELVASGAVLSSGAISHAIVYLRGKSPAQARFVLYDSHASFIPDVTQRFEQAQQEFSAKHTQTDLDKMDPVEQATLHAASLPLTGSFLAIAPTLNALMAIARADGRWPVNVASRDALPRDLQSPVFIDVLKTRPTSPARRHPSPPKPVLLDPYQRARTTANAFIAALSHAQTTQDFKEIGDQFEESIHILSESAQNELIQRFGEAQIKREKELKQEAAAIAARQKAEAEQARLADQALRAAAPVRISPTAIVSLAPRPGTKPARPPLADRLVAEAEQLASHAQTMDITQLREAISTIADTLHARLNDAQQKKVARALETVDSELIAKGGV